MNERESDEDHDDSTSLQKSMDPTVFALKTMVTNQNQQMAKLMKHNDCLTGVLKDQSDSFVKIHKAQDDRMGQTLHQNATLIAQQATFIAHIQQEREENKKKQEQIEKLQKELEEKKKRPSYQKRRERSSYTPIEKKRLNVTYKKRDELIQLVKSYCMKDERGNLLDFTNFDGYLDGKKYTREKLIDLLKMNDYYNKTQPATAPTFSLTDSTVEDVD